VLGLLVGDVGDDDKVMTAARTSVTVRYMATDDPITMLVLQEFRLRAADDGDAAARIVAASSTGSDSAIPLLTSIEDRRDVATLRALHAGEATEADAVERAGLQQLVSRWAAPKQYEPRLAERSQSPPSSFRLAVTESGINADGAAVQPSDEPARRDATRAIGLLWIGAPVGTDAGLLVLLGGYDEPRAVGDDPPGWPLPLSRDLGVRIYENTRP
jgi:hypothetical protein